MHNSNAGATWWRPEPIAIKADADTSRVAFIALVAFTIILLLAPQTFIPALKTLRIALLAAGVAIGAHIVDATLQRRPIVPAGRETGIALSLLAWAVVTIPFSYWPSGSVQLMLDLYLKAIVFFWLLGTLVTTRDRLRTLALALTFCSVPLAAMAIQHFLAGDFLNTGTSGIKRIAGYTGLSGNPNDLALTLNLIIPVAGAVLFSARTRMERLVGLAALVLSVPAVILTFSRTGFLTLAAIVLATVVCLARRRALGAAIAILIVALAAPSLFPGGYAERLSTITDIEADTTGSAQGRWSDFGVATEIVARNPVIGVGLGQDILALNEARGATWRSVHNAYLQYAVDLGLTGLFLFLWLLGASFVAARRVERAALRHGEWREIGIFAAGVQIALVAFVVAAFFHPIAYQFYFFCVAGLAVAVRNVCRTEAAQRAAEATS